jgi:hypothetical protein
MRHLAFVHDALKQDGWPGVAKLRESVLANAIAQARELVGNEPSSLMTSLIERLRLVKAASEVRHERHEHEARSTDGDSTTPMVVFESTFEDFEESQRPWCATRPSGFVKPE